MAFPMVDLMAIILTKGYYFEVHIEHF